MVSKFYFLYKIKNVFSGVLVKIFIRYKCFFIKHYKRFLKFLKMFLKFGQKAHFFFSKIFFKLKTLYKIIVKHTLIIVFHLKKNTH